MREIEVSVETRVQFVRGDRKQNATSDKYNFQLREFMSFTEIWLLVFVKAGNAYSLKITWMTIEQDRLHLIQSSMLKLCKNEINTNISLYHVYLPKLHVNILKYNRSDLFVLSLEPYRKMNGSIMSPSLVNTLQNHNVNLVFDFDQYRYILWE